MSKKNNGRGARGPHQPELGALGIALQQAGFHSSKRGLDSSGGTGDRGASSQQNTSSQPPSSAVRGGGANILIKDIPPSWNDPSAVRLSSHQHPEQASKRTTNATTGENGTGIKGISVPVGAPSTNKSEAPSATKRELPTKGSKKLVKKRLPGKHAPVVTKSISRTVLSTSAKPNQPEQVVAPPPLQVRLTRRMAELTAAVESRAIRVALQSGASDDDILELSKRLASGGGRVEAKCQALW
jgi:hypothetical protein